MFQIGAETQKGCMPHKHCSAYLCLLGSESWKSTKADSVDSVLLALVTGTHLGLSKVARLSSSCGRNSSPSLFLKLGKHALQRCARHDQGLIWPSPKFWIAQSSHQCALGLVQKFLEQTQSLLGIPK